MDRTSLFVLILVGLACGGPRPAESDEPFEHFASRVFQRLNSAPIADTIDIELGLFGPLHVMAGEHIVMGRYRYRVDSSNGAQMGHMAFFVREIQSEDARPVVLSFHHSETGWTLAEAQRARAPGDTASVALDRVLAAHLDNWASKSTDSIVR